MRKLLYLCLLFFIIPLSASAQETKMEAEFGAQANTLAREFAPHEFLFAFKYNIWKHLYLKVEYERAIALFKVDDTKDQYVCNTFGGKVGYSFLNISNLSLCAEVGAGDNLKKKKHGTIPITTPGCGPISGTIPSSRSSGSWSEDTIPTTPISTTIRG